MRAPEFIVNLFNRWAPVAPETLSNLKIELSNLYQKQMENLSQKELKNMPLRSQAEELNKELEKLEPHTPEYEKKLFELEQIGRKMEKPTILERIVSYLDKPLVRFGLMVAFIFVSRYIAKKLTEVKEPEKEQETDFESRSYPNPGNFNPYGYGYPPPPPYFQQQPYQGK